MGMGMGTHRSFPAERNEREDSPRRVGGCIILEERRRDTALEAGVRYNETGTSLA